MNISHIYSFNKMFGNFIPLDIHISKVIKIDCLKMPAVCASSFY